MLEFTEVTLIDGLTVLLVAGDCGLRAIDFRSELPAKGERNDANRVTVEAARQLRAYFAGQLRRFDLPLDMQGTEFQLRVWRELERIPYGETRRDRKSTRLNSSHLGISYAVFCLKKKKKKKTTTVPETRRAHDGYTHDTTVGE